MDGKVDNIISLAGLRKEDMSLADIREFFEQLPDILGNRSAEPPPAQYGPSPTGRSPDDDPAVAMRGVLDDLTLVFRRALELAVGRRELPPDTNIDALAESLTIIFRSAISMSRRGHSADDLRRYLDIALGVLD